MSQSVDMIGESEYRAKSHPGINGKEASVAPPLLQFEPAGHKLHSTVAFDGRWL